jgi:GxxExxY protein
MAANNLIQADEVYRIIGAAFSVLKELGHGLDEKPYENALVVELGLCGISYDQQKRFSVLYKNVQVAEFIPDLIAFDSVIVDAKAIDGITDHERGQMISYLRITKLKVGLIINFKRAKLEWERIVLSDHSR